MTVAILFCDPKGVYSTLPDLDLWPESRDARLYEGPHPVVAHPPCARWCQLAKLNERRWGCKVGSDAGCFKSALLSLRKYGGVLEHPAMSLAWAEHCLCEPGETAFAPEHGWFRHAWGDGQNYWVCEVWQSAYDHPARKKTWLAYCGKRPPFELNWRKLPGTHQIGGGIHTGNNRLPKLNKKEASATPLRFAETLIALARHSRGDSIDY